MTDVKELEAQIEALKKELEATKALKVEAPPQVEAPIVAPAPVAAPEPSKELMALTGVVKELSEKFEARIAALEHDGKSVTKVETKELSSEPAYFVRVNRKTGTVGE